MTPTNGADEVDPIPDEGKNLTSIAAIPQLLAEYSKDNFHPPESVSSKARSEFKWECKEGHSWFQSPYYRTLDGIVRECGYCTKEWPDFEKSFYETHPLHAYFWDQDENKGLKPWMVTAEDTVWVNFKCIRCGCKWAESLATFALKSCSVNLSSTFVLVNTLSINRPHIESNPLALPFALI